jgi:hypothetical protein
MGHPGGHSVGRGKTPKMTDFRGYRGYIGLYTPYTPKNGVFGGFFTPGNRAPRGVPKTANIPLLLFFICFVFFSFFYLFLFGFFGFCHLFFVYFSKLYFRVRGFTISTWRSC